MTKAVPTTVLLADDHPLVRSGVRSIIESNDQYQVVADCGNGRDAVRLARQLEPDIVIMDIGMPDLNGAEATQRILAARAETRVLALSMLSDPRYIQRMLGAGACGYILKDCAGEELLDALAAVCAGQVYLSPQVTGVVVAEYRQSGASLTPEPVLSSREREVLQLIAEGHSTADIAQRLVLSIKTVESHRKRIMDKLELRNVAQLTRYAIKHGLTALD